MRGEEKSTTEKEKTDRLRERRKKKSAQRIRHKEAERIEKAVDKANPGLGNKHAKNNALRQLQQAEKEGTVTLVTIVLILRLCDEFDSFCRLNANCPFPRRSRTTTRNL